MSDGIRRLAVASLRILAYDARHGRLGPVDWDFVSLCCDLLDIDAGTVRAHVSAAVAERRKREGVRRVHHRRVPRGSGTAAVCVRLPPEAAALLGASARRAGRSLSRAAADLVIRPVC